MAKPAGAIGRAKRAAAFQRRLDRGALKQHKKTSRALARANKKALEATTQQEESS